MKVCSVCEIEKENEEFGKDSRKKDGLKYLCKECFNRKYKMSKEVIAELNGLIWKHSLSQYGKPEIDSFKKELQHLTIDQIKKELIKRKIEDVSLRAAVEYILDEEFCK